MNVGHAMSTPVVTVPPETSLEAAALRMAEAGVGALPVVDRDDQVVGMLTDRDLVVRAMATGLSPRDEWVQSVMSTDPVTVPSDWPVPAALHAMRTIDARHLPVTEGNRLVGMVSVDDLFCYLVVQLGELARVVNAVRQFPEPGRPASGPSARV